MNSLIADRPEVEMNDGETKELVNHYRKEIGTVVAGRPWIVATGVVVGSVNIAKSLIGVGATKVMAIGITRGTGLIDISEENVEVVNLEVRSKADMMEAVRFEESVFEIT